MLVLDTFRFIGLAHLRSLWGCLAFMGFLSGFGLVGLGLRPLGFLFAVLVRFSLGCLRIWCGLGALASRRYGVLLLLLLLWLPARSALSIWGQFRSKFTQCQ